MCMLGGGMSVYVHDVCVWYLCVCTWCLCPCVWCLQVYVCVCILCVQCVCVNVCLCACVMSVCLYVCVYLFRGETCRRTKKEKWEKKEKRMKVESQRPFSFLQSWRLPWDRSSFCSMVQLVLTPPFVLLSQWCAGKCLATGSLGGEKVLIWNVCQCLWCKYLYPG